MLARLKAVALDMKGRWKGDGLNDSAAGVSFWTVLSIFPLLLTLTSMLGIVGSIIGESATNSLRDEIVKRLNSALQTTGGALVDTVVDIITRPRGGVAVVGLVIAIWSMSKGFAGLCRALARIHGDPAAREGIRGRLAGLWLGVLTVLVIIVLGLQVVVGPLLGFEKSLPNDGGILLTIWSYLRWPVLAAGVIAWLAALLSWGPGTGVRWRDGLPGAVLAAVGWVAASFGFKLYVALAGGGNKIYWVLGDLLVGLTWLYILVAAVLVGGLLDAVLLGQRVTGPVAAEDSTAPVPASATERA